MKRRGKELTSDQSVPATPSVDLASPADPMHSVPTRAKSSLVKSILNPVIDYLPKLGSNRKRAAEGLIAPRTPIRGSPLHTPVNMSIQTNYFPWNGEDGSSQSMSGSASGSGSLSLSRTNSPGLIHMGLGKGRPGSIPGQKTPPPPRRVQSEMMTSGLNPRGIATRNGVPAIPDGSGSGSGAGVIGIPGVESDMSRRTGRIPSRPSTPSMSLGPERGEALGRVEIVDTKGQAQPKRKDD